MKIDGRAIDDVEDRLLEYSSNCSDTTSGLWFYLTDEADDCCF